MNVSNMGDEVWDFDWSMIGDPPPRPSACEEVPPEDEVTRVLRQVITTITYMCRFPEYAPCGKRPGAASNAPCGKRPGVASSASCGKRPGTAAIIGFCVVFLIICFMTLTNTFPSNAFLGFNTVSFGHPHPVSNTFLCNTFHGFHTVPFDHLCFVAHFHEQFLCGSGVCFHEQCLVERHVWQDPRVPKGGAPAKDPEGHWHVWQDPRVPKGGAQAQDPEGHQQTMYGFMLLEWHAMHPMVPLPLPHVFVSPSTFCCAFS